MVFDESASLKDNFYNARKTLIEMFPCQKRPGKTYQGLIKARKKLSEMFYEKLAGRLCRCHQAVAGDFWKVGNWIPYAADGSRLEMPRTSANEAAFGCAGRQKTGPQLLITVLYHMGSGLPWRWRIGPGVDSERHQLRSLLHTLPGMSLLVADAGFVGYDLIKEIMSHSLHFLLRVGGNVSLLTDLGFDCRRRGDIVYLWPQGKRDQAPLTLRLIRLKVNRKYSRGSSDIYLISNVFDTDSLSEESAGHLYRRRWGVEVFYRDFKQTLEQRKLRSRSPEQVLAEAHWALTGLLLLNMMSVDALVARGTDPLHLSVSEALRTVRRAMRTKDRWRRCGDLRVCLGKALKDDYQRRGRKQARDWPHKKKESPPQPPKIRRATVDEKRLAARFYHAA